MVTTIRRSDVARRSHRRMRAPSARVTMHNAVALTATCTGSFRTTSPTDMTATDVAASTDAVGTNVTARTGSRCRGPW